MSTKELLALYFDEPHHDGLRLAHAGTSLVYQYVLNDWSRIVDVEECAALEVIDIKRFTDNPEQYNTLDIACCRVDHIIKRIQGGYAMRPADNVLALSLHHTLSQHAKDILSAAGYFYHHQAPRYSIDEG